jgi:hypothetical protein
MSYLLGPRLHFAGRFKADVSTVNNEPTHFNNATFQPGFQQPGAEGLWNPGGSGSWQLIGCTVTSAMFADGTIAGSAADDPVVGLAIAEGGGPPAKLVDLDPEQQMVSQIWGLQVTVGKSGASPACSGKFEVAAFSDIWTRASAGGDGDVTMAACWQSVLTDLTWGDLANSRFLQELKQAAAAGMLSIKFNVDGFNMDSTSPNFATGRIVGIIGAALPGEPHQFVMGRHCMPAASSPVSVNFFSAVVDDKRSKLVVDLGNALPTTGAGGPVDSSLQLELGVLLPNQQFSSLGQVKIGGAGWYEQTAGVCEFPADRKLSAAELQTLADAPIVLATPSADGTTMVAQEGIDGLHVRADSFVYRLSPGDQASVTLYASRFGRPAANASVAAVFDASGLQGGNGNLQIAKPASALTFPSSLTTDQNGVARLDLTAHPLAHPRQYIDGQVYGIRYRLPQAANGAGAYSNPSDFISVLVWSSFTIPAAPNWWTDVHPILQQYANLYPFMGNFLNLGDYDDVVANSARLRAVFTLPEGNPHYMPVTRDLSPAKRQGLLSWLATTGNGGKPNLGTPPAAQAVAMVAAMRPAAAAEGVSVGGKTAAIRRRGPHRIVLARAGN